MRVSVDANDPGYITNAHEYMVFLDDVELTGCVTADTDLGMAEVYVTGPDGHLQLEGDRIKTVTRYGKVEVFKGGELCTPSN